MEKVIAVGLVAGILILLLAISWGFCCGIMWLISLCFNIGFSLKIATGIWLVMWLLGSIFKSPRNDK